MVLNRSAQGDREASELAWTYFQDDIRQLAELAVRKEFRLPDLQATVIINEVWIRLFGRTMEEAISEDNLEPNEPAACDDETIWANRGHFWAAIRRSVECFLVDEHRRATARKRGGGWKRASLDVALGELAELSTAADADIPALRRALERLHASSPLAAAVVSHRYLLGMTVRQTAACLEVSPRTVDNHWKIGSTRLRQYMAEDERDGVETAIAV